jgi:hypothetical protein
MWGVVLVVGLLLAPVCYGRAAESTAEQEKAIAEIVK